jgi:hypothetical protein
MKTPVQKHVPEGSTSLIHLLLVGLLLGAVLSPPGMAEGANEFNTMPCSIRPRPG